MSAGRGLGLSRDDMQGCRGCGTGATRSGPRRRDDVRRSSADSRRAGVRSGSRRSGLRGDRDPVSEFRRMLRLSKLCLDGDEMTDDQRDALCNMGESLGLTGGQAEDLIDEYLDEVAGMTPPPLAPAVRTTTAPAPSAKPVPAAKPAAAPMAAAAGKKPEPAPVTASPKETVNTSPLARAQERQKYPNYTNSAAVEMLLVPSGTFFMEVQRGPRCRAARTARDANLGELFLHVAVSDHQRAVREV